MSASNVISADTMADLLKANKADEATQAARLESLKGKHMLFVAGDMLYPQFAKMLQEVLLKLKEHGVIIYAVFQEGKQDGKYREACIESGCFDHETFADVACENGAQEIVNAVKEAGFPVEYAWSPHEATQQIVADVQNLMGMPGNSPQAYERARDKYLTRACLKEAGLNKMKALQIWSVRDADQAEETVGFPMIIKPTIGMGSSGVYKANDREELDMYLNRLFQDIQSDWTLNRNTVGKQAPVVAETFISPTVFEEKVDEFDCEILLWEGKRVYGNVIDNFLTRPPYFAETGSCAPSVTSEQIQQEMVEYATQCLLAMGFTRGGFHVETWYTKDGPILIEANARVGGGATVETHKTVWGVDPMLEFALTMLDVPINPPRKEVPDKAYGLLLINSEITGVLKE